MPTYGYGSTFGGEPITVRPPQHGIPLWAKQQILGTLIPNGVNRWVGLFSGMPNFSGIGGTEAAIPRVLHTAWRSQDLSHIAGRINTGAILFNAPAAQVTALGFGIWDASSGGVLQGFGLLRTSKGIAKVYYLGTTDQLRFSDGTLRVEIQ